MTIYASSTADIMINGINKSPWLPMVLALLAVAGVLAGIMMRVQSFLFLGTLASLLRVVAIVVGGVSLLALLQALGTLVAERGATIAVLRAGGAGPATVLRLLAGAITVLVVPALAAALAIERLVLGPLVTGLAAGSTNRVT